MFARQGTRRQFLSTVTAASAAAVAAPLFVPASILGREDKAAPSERIRLGVIGTGGQGRYLINTFLGEKDTEILAVADVDAKHLALGKAAVEKKGDRKESCAAYKDFRALLDHKGLDAIIVATPDHWHALAAVAAARAGKDVYCEKPLANSIAEGRAICDAVKENKRILQTGSHERSGLSSRFACELVRNGKIGTLKTVRINLPCNDPHHKKARAIGEGKPAPVPPELDYDFWLGHTAKVPYVPERVHFNWRWVLAYGGGEMTDRGAHVIDLGHLGAGLDATGPTLIEASGVREKGLYDVFWDYKFQATYPTGVVMVGSTAGPRGVKFEGSDGWVFIHVHGGKLEASSPDLLKTRPDEPANRISPRHVRNFLDCVKSRKAPIAAAETGHRTASVCHLLNIAMLTGRKLKWDPAAEQFTDDSEANKLLRPSMRAPWKL